MSYLEFLKLASPEAVVALTALVVLSIGLLAKRATFACAFVAGFGLVIAIVAILILPRNHTMFGGMLVISPLTSLFKIICLALAFFTILLTQAGKKARHPGEYLALVLLATVGLMLLVASEELLMIFIGLELLGLSLYVMAAFDKEDVRSAEEIFLVWEHLECIHTVRDQPDLRNVWNDRSRANRREIGNDIGAAVACGRSCHAARRVCIQNRRRALSLVGA